MDIHINFYFLAAQETQTKFCCFHFFIKILYKSSFFSISFFRERGITHHFISLHLVKAVSLDSLGLICLKLSFPSVQGYEGHVQDTYSLQLYNEKEILVVVKSFSPEHFLLFLFVSLPGPDTWNSKGQGLNFLFRQTIFLQDDSYELRKGEDITDVNIRIQKTLLKVCENLTSLPALLLSPLFFLQANSLDQTSLLQDWRHRIGFLKGLSE